jgi:translation initiation factor IF-3
LEEFSISKFPPQRQVSKGPQILTPDIRAMEVRLIDGEINEVISRRDAEALARERGLDLVVMSFDSAPLVVRLVDFGKFKFENDKKAREAKKKQHVVEVKEIKMSVRIDDHDYDTKKDHAIKFLEAGNKVKCTIRLKGRETQHANLAFALGRKFVVDLQDFGSPEGDIRMEGRTITIIIGPARKK